MKKVWSMYFSGTGTTEKVVKRIGNTLGEKLGVERGNINFTPKASREKEYTFSKEEIVVLGVPVIAGRVPNLLLNFLDTIRGEGALAVPIVLFGNRNYDDAFKILETDFILGKGLGGFSTNGARAYPHNLFLELLCELGMVGTLLIIVLIFVPLLVKPNRFQLMTKSNFYALPLIVAIFIRSMMSSDLIDSITLITAIIVISNTQTNKLCQQSLSI